MAQAPPRPGAVGFNATLLLAGKTATGIEEERT